MGIMRSSYHPMIIIPQSYPNETQHVGYKWHVGSQGRFIHASIDHRPLRARFSCTLNLGKRLQRKMICAEALRTPAGAAAVQEAFKTLPLIPWSVDSTTHVQCIHEHLHRTLSRMVPSPVARPRNPAYTAGTLALVHQKRRARKRLRELFHSERRLILRSVFDSIRGETRFALSIHRMGPPVSVSLASVRNQSLVVAAALHRLNRDLGNQMQADKAAFLRKEMAQARDLGSAHFAFRIRAILRTGRKFKTPALLPAFRKPDQTEAVGQQAVLHALGSHYATAERAHEVLVVDMLRSRARASHLPLTCTLHAADMPTLPELARVMSGIACRKAGGISRLPPEVYRLAPQHAAIATYPVLCKAVLQGHLPLQWAGGKAHSIPKSVTGLDQPSAWRSIMLLEADAKAVQKAFRPALTNIAGQSLCPGQHGGFPGQTLSMVSARVKAHFAHLKYTGLLGGVLFIDSRAAYYSVARDLLVLPAGTMRQADDLWRRARVLFAHEAAQREFVSGMLNGGLLERASASPALLRFVTAQTSGTWYTTDPESPAIWCTESGTAPGSPIADALFAVIYASFLTELQCAMAAKGLWTVSEPASADSAVPTWADDTAVLFATVTADEVRGALAEVAELACNGLRRLGLEPNLAAGKTEAVLQLQGTGSRTVKQQAFCPSTSGVPFRGPDGQTLFVRLAPEYVHLGSVVRADLHELPDIKRRSALAKQTFAPLRKRILCNSYLTRPEKTDLLVQRVFAKFLHGSGLWRLATLHEKEAASEPLRSIQRSCVRCFTGLSCQGMSSDEVAAVLDVNTAEELLASERMRAALEVSRVRANDMWDALVQDGVWLHLVKHDFVSAIGPERPDLALDPAATPAAVLSFLRQHPQALRSVCRHFARNRRRSREVLVPAAIAAAQARAGTVRVPDGPDTAVTHDDGYMCLQCGKTFPDSRTCAVHLARHHQVPTLATSVCFGTRCEVCMQEFWTQSRLQQHLRKARRCLQVYSHSDLDGSGTGPDVDRRSHCWQPATRVEGPQPFWATQRPA